MQNRFFLPAAPTMMLASTLALAFACVLPAQADDIAVGQAYVKTNCAVCHDVSPARAANQGPPLFGVVGRKAGSVKGFGYSPAMKDAGAKGKVWTQAELDIFLADPQKSVPGTLMPVNIADGKNRKAVIVYLASLSGAAKTVPAATKSAAVATPDVKAASKVTTLTSEANFDWHKDAPGVRHKVTVADLPPPFTTPSAGNSPSYTAPDDGTLPKVPAGFTISIFSRDAEHPRLLRTAPNGDLFVAESGRGRISVYHNDHGALGTTKTIFASGLEQPFGIAFYPADHPKYVYVANLTSIVRFPYGDGDQTARGPAETVVANLSTAGGHSTRDIAFSVDGKTMFVSIGSNSNVAEGMTSPPGGTTAWESAHGRGSSWDSEDGRAVVLSFDPEGAHRHVFATGIRNCVGLGVRADTGEVYCATNERDGLGDNLVPDYFSHIQDGAFYGWPWYYLGAHEDPRHKGERPDLAGAITVPDNLFVSHSAPLSFSFYAPPPAAAHAFPKSYWGSAFVALHGSWNRAQRSGSKVVRVLFKDGRPTGEYEDFMTGLVVDDKTVAGRPVGVAVGPDGALYVSDDTGSRIWRIAPK